MEKGMRSADPRDLLRIAAAQKKKEKDYWLNQLSADLVKSIFPLDSKVKVSKGQDQEFDSVTFTLQGEVFSRLMELSKGSDARLYIILVAGLKVLLKRYSGNNDIITGAPVIKRQHPDTRLINTVLVFRDQLPDHITFRELLGRVKQTIIQATENQNYPLEILLEDLDMSIRTPGEGFPLFDVAVLLENIHDKKDIQHVALNMIFSFSGTGSELQGTCEYNRHKYHQTTITRITANFVHLFQDVLFDLEKPLSAIDILSEGEKKQILFEFNHTKKEIPRTKSYQEFFEEQVVKSPKNPAVIHHQERMPYEELNREANCIAYYLREHGVKPGSLVGLYLKRSIQFLACIIGVFKAGGAYLPLDVDYPVKRIHTILEDSEPGILITGVDQLETVNNIRTSLPHLQHILCPDSHKKFANLLAGYPEENPGKHFDLNHLSYVIYTSGTTGKPKGVMIHQLGMMNHLYANIDFLSVTAADVIAQTASPCFDISVWQFLAGGMTGGITFIIDKEVVLDPGGLVDVLKQGKVTILELVPSLMIALLDIIEQRNDKELKDLRWMLPTGEALGAALAKEWYKYFPHIRLVNAYGPAEASDDVTLYVVDKNSLNHQSTIPIGKPLQNLHIYILDNHLSLCPIGVTGEICISGIGIGKGYLKDDARTKQAFIPNPFLEKIHDPDYAVLYRTGDMGFYRADGNIEFMGRLDHQVKIRGNRIELEEIENVMLDMEGIKEAAVLVEEDQQGDRNLKAYFASDKVMETSELRTYLAEKLPGYMIPSYFKQIVKMPLTPNGKIDRKALPGLETENPLLHQLNTFTHLLQEAFSIEPLEVSARNIQVLSKEEKTALFFDLNRIPAEFAAGEPGTKPLHRLFEQQVDRTPDNPAVVCEGRQFTYRELNKKSNRLARVLRTRGVSAGTIVGIMMAPSIDMIVGIIGVLKAGGAYLLIHPEASRQHISSLLEKYHVPILLAASKDLKNHQFTTLQDLYSVRINPRVTGVRPQVKDLNALPIPDRSLISYEKYNQYIGQAMVKNTYITILASRGCPFNCAYCHKIWPKKNVVRSAENILEEVLHYYQMGVRRFVIIDDIFNLDVKNSSRFFRLIIKNGLKVQLFFPNGMRGDLFTKEYIDLMVEAGLVNVALALETASPRLQKIIRKNLDIHRFHRNTSYMCETYPQVILEIFLMHGFPGETEEEAMMTMDFIKSLKWVHFPYINILRIFSNTDMEKLAIEQGISREAIFRAENLAYHEIPDILPFDKSFTLQFQTDFLNDYFLSKERLLHLLPYQMRILTENDIVQKYDTYLPSDINSFDELLQLSGITRNELNSPGFLKDDHMLVPNINEKLKENSPTRINTPDPLKILLLDLSQFFSTDTDMLYDLYDPPLGLIYLMTYLNRQLPGKVEGKIAKSRVDFDSYEALKTLVLEFEPDIIGIRALTFHKDFFHKTAALVRHWGLEVPIIAGGPYATSGYQRILQDRNIDLVVLGEGEITFRELIGRMIENKQKLPDETVLKEIAGLAFIPGNEKMKNRFARDIILLDELKEKLSRESGENLENINNTNDLAWINYTALSPGEWKDVMLGHHQVYGLMSQLPGKFQYPTYAGNSDPDGNGYPVVSYVFDGSAPQVFGALFQGGSLYIAPADLPLKGAILLEYYIKNNPDEACADIWLWVESIGEDRPKFQEPMSGVEGKLAGIWSEVLGLEEYKIGREDDFFELGGHSLRAVTLAAKIHKELDIKLPLVEIFKAPTIKGLAKYINSAAETTGITAKPGDKYASIEPVEEKEYYPLSSVQKRLYILQQMDLKSMAYNMPEFFPLEETLAPEELEEIFKRLIQRHESLRTTYHMINDEPVQKVHKAHEVEFTLDSDSPYPSTDPEAVLYHFIRPFDLSRAPLFRIGIIKTGEGKGLLMIDLHHIAADGSSSEILEREFRAICSREDLHPLRIQHKDFSEWQASEKQKELVKQQESYWLKEFSEEIPVLNLPTDFPRPLMQGYEGNWVSFVLNAEETKIIKDIARTNDVTLFMCLLALFNILFSKLSGQEDIILGTPIAARRHADLQYIIGMLANTMALRNYPSNEKPFETFLREVKQRTLEAYENQEYPFEDLVEKIFINRDTSRNPVFDVMLNLLSQWTSTGENPEIKDQPPYQHQKGTSRFDMAFSAVDRGERIGFGLEYSTRLFTPATIERFINYLKTIVHSLPRSMEQKLSHIEFIPAEEKQEILQLCNGFEEQYDTGETIGLLFEEQVEKRPNHIALLGMGQNARGILRNVQLTYQGLNRESNQLAHLLREKGVEPDSVVGLMVERSIEMIIGVLAVIKAGGAYLPIDPQYPQQRIETMLNDSEATVLLTNPKELASFSITGLKNMKARNENIVVTPARDQITNFDRLPIPDRTLIDYKKYHQYIGEAPAKHTITLQATRGCPYHCLYCHKIWPKKHVTRSAENIFKEISYAYEAGIRRFVFIDDIFNLDQKNAARFLETIIKRKMDIQLFFPNGFRADILSRDFIDLMAAAGTVNLDVALESASPRIQKLIRKNLNLEKFKENVQYITETYPQIILEMELMLGFPTESQEEAIMTQDFLESLKWVHFPNLHILKIFPNTDICTLAIENGISKEVIQQSANLAFHELPDTLPFSKSFTRQLQAKFMGEYFLSKKRLLHLLPFQMKILSEDELIQKYDSYLSSEIKHFDDILRYTGISREELGKGNVQLMQEEQYQAPDFVQKISRYFPVKTKKPPESAFRILLLDLSQLFSKAHEYMLHHQIEEPLGLLYLMTYLNEKFKDRIHGKIFKSRIDFDSYDELKTIIFDFKPHLIGIRTLSFYRDFFHKAVLMIRQWGMDVPIVAGGPYATSDYHLILQDPHVDVVVLGEGEFTLAHLVEKIMENNNQLPGEEVLKALQGIAFRSRKNQWNIEKKTRNILLPDEIPGRLNRYSTANPEPINQADDLLYVIYTSGSTGTPKGVMLEHCNLVNLIRYQYNHTDIDFSRVLQFTSIGFDVSAQEIFSTLLAGGVLSLVSREMLSDVPQLFNKVKSDHIKTLFLPTSFLKFVMNEEDFLRLLPASVTHIVTAGEQMIVNERFKRYLKENDVYFHNHYGPSETHVVTAFTVIPGGDTAELPPIGRPVLNTSIYLLDKGYQPVPVGVTGELFIGGIQVGRGYLNNPELTAERFISVFYKSYRSYKTYISKKIYKTGDLARWMSDGNVEFLGRIDHQVKIRGFRVELGEIESRLLNHPGIKEAAATVGVEETGDKYLCAYIASYRDIEISGLREYLSKVLPDYMIPSYFVFLEKIPITPNGKIDRKALPAPEVTTDNKYTAPRNTIEKKLAEFWAEVLNVQKDVIGLDRNFFELGGQSLKATVLTSKVHKAFNMRLPLGEIFKTPTIRGLAKYIKTSKKDKYWEIKPVEKKDYYHLSSAQLRLYILQRMDLENVGYNLPEVISLPEEIQKGNLEETFIQLIRRHESLRTSFHMKENEPVQKIQDKVEFEIEYYETGKRQKAKGNKEELMPESLIKNFIRPFDLSRAPLLRVGLVKLPHTPAALRGHPSQEGKEDKYSLMVDMHHIISDGVSHEILVRDFMNLHHGEKLPPLPIQYKDFSQWQNREKESGTFKMQEAYWLKEFSQDVPLLELPTDFVRPAVQSFAGGAVSFEISPQETSALARVALTNGSTLYMMLLAIFNILLSKLSNQEDIVVGTPVAGRRHADLQQIMGMFVNTLAMRNYPHGEKSFLEFLADIKERTLQAFDNQEYPFEELVEKAAVNRDASRNPLFDIMFVLQNMGNIEDKPGEISPGEPGQMYPDFETGISKFDITLVCVEVVKSLVLSFEYCTKLFKKETIERFIIYFKKIVSSVTAEARQKISEIEVLPGEEKKQVLFDFNDTEAEYPKDKTIHELFAEQVGRTPDRVALVEPKSQIPEPGSQTGKITFRQTNLFSKNNSITYRELNERANQLAHLLKEKGVDINTIVAVMIERCLNLPVAMLSILKAGGAYLPIDPGYPAERQKYILKDSAAKVLVTTGLLFEEDEKVRRWEGEKIFLDSDYCPGRGEVSSPASHQDFVLASAFAPPPSSLTSTSTRQVSPANLIYVIYTSGSTGKPKGVPVIHRGFVNLVYFHQKAFGVDPADRMSQVAGPGFDAMAFEVWPCLLNGATLIIANDEIRTDAGKIKEWLIKNQVTISFQPTVIAEQLIMEKWSLRGAALKSLRTAGEQLTKYPASQLPFRFYNLYGPTEDTVWTTWARVGVKTYQADKKYPSIGKPIANHRAYVMGNHGTLQPVNIGGELCIAGDGLAEGYLNQPEQTAEKFVENPYIPGERMYKTGDLVRWLTQGNIEFLGRIDHQVKIRGFRIELGEIESRLANHPGITEAVAVVKNINREKYLCAYIVPVGKIEIPGLREYLSLVLPDYMLPSYFTFIEKIPLTPNGKIDRKALPETVINVKEEYKAPKNETEEKLTEIWSNLLKIEKNHISIDADFFQLGGHSLNATIMVSQIKKEFNLVLPLVDVFKNPTIESLSKYIKQAALDIIIGNDDRLILLKPGVNSDKHLFFIHDGTGQVDGYIECCNHLTHRLNYWGIRAEPLRHLEPCNRTIEELAREYIEKLKKVQPHGPYFIAGWSLGGTIAFEMVGQLEETGEKILFLGLIDSPGPQKDEQKNIIEFNPESEKELILGFFPESPGNHTLKEKLNHVGDSSGTWAAVVSWLEENQVSVEFIKKLIPGDLAQTIPGYGLLGIKELIDYLNTWRTLTNARARYIPSKKVTTTLHYFKASGSAGGGLECWKDYCAGSIRSYEIMGDHFSILKEPGVDEVAKKVDIIFHEMV